MTKVLGGILLIVIFAIMFPIVMESITDAQTDSVTDSFPGCIVGGGETDVVLTQDLYEARTSSVTSMTATGSGAVPVADSYVEATNTLTISGLGADTPQDITVTYIYDRTEDFTGLSQFMRLTPLLMWLAVMAALVGGAIFAFRSK